MIRQRLKTETAPTHHRLDRLIGQQEPFSTVSGYGNFLINMRRLYVRYADSLNRVADLADLPTTAQRLIDAIDQDLQSIGLSPYDSPYDSPETLNDHSPLHTSIDQCWGHAYVMEGSAMGASIMMKSASAKLPASASTHYLHLSGAHAKSRWPLFVKALQKMSDDVGCHKMTDPVLDSNGSDRRVSETTVSDTAVSDTTVKGTCSDNANQSSDRAQHAVAAANEVFAFALQLFDAQKVNSD